MLHPCEAAVSMGQDDETIRVRVNELASVIRNYKEAARHARKMKPKAPKAKAAPEAPNPAPAAP